MSWADLSLDIVLVPFDLRKNEGIFRAMCSLLVGYR